MNEIETKFSETLNEVLERGFVIIQDHRCEIAKEDDWYEIIYGKNNLYLQIESQPKDPYFSGYIPDFAIYINNQNAGFVVEIDGHEWHEKTKEQVRADKEKDRSYLKNKFIPIRFTGSEVYHNTKRCVDELFEIIACTFSFFISQDLRIEKMELEKIVDDYEEKLKKYCYELNKYRNGDKK